MPKVSVLMPVYKTQEEYLRAAIESILSQTFTDFEFLILDDCPEESREQIIASYNDERIKYSQNSCNLGISASRNKLIDMAQGEYLAVFDHDDISLPERLAKEVAYLDANPQCGVVSCAFKKLVENTININPENNEQITRKMFVSCALLHPAAMIRKATLDSLNLRYEEKFSPAEDYALWCRMIDKTEFHNLQEVLFYYRDHAQNTTHNQLQKMQEKTFLIQAFARVNNAALWEGIEQQIRYVTYIKLFGIPMFKIVRCGKYSKCYLFNRITIYYAKTKVII
jgi:glycosyltransferase involved in cell wall biosynthesis